MDVKVFHSEFKTGICLSGGAARGLTHVGAIRELEKNGIVPDMVAGASVGALLGALYAVDPDIDKVERSIVSFLSGSDFSEMRGDIIQGSMEGAERRSIFRKLVASFRKSIFFGISMSQVGFLPEGKLERIVSGILPDIDIADCKIPFGCVATDIVNNRPYYFTKGPLVKAIAASCSIPGLFPPVAYDGMLLVDGSWSMQNPVPLVRHMGADFVIAINIVQDIFGGNGPGNGLEVVLRANTVTRSILSEMELKDADFVLRPDMCEVDWWDFKRSRICVVKGSEKTAEEAAEIHRLLNKARLKKLMKLEI